MEGVLWRHQMLGVPAPSAPPSPATVAIHGISCEAPTPPAYLVSGCSPIDPPPPPTATLTTLRLGITVTPPGHHHDSSALVLPNHQPPPLGRRRHPASPVSLGVAHLTVRTHMAWQHNFVAPSALTWLKGLKIKMKIDEVI